MATNLSIDPDLLDLALAVSGERTKKAAVTKALQEFIARRRQKRLLDLMGQLEWDEVELASHRLVMAAKKIKTLFQQARIPVWERAQWPVLADAESIVWARRFGTAAAVAAGPDSPRILAVGELEVR